MEAQTVLGSIGELNGHILLLWVQLFRINGQESVNVLTLSACKFSLALRLPYGSLARKLDF